MLALLAVLAFSSLTGRVTTDGVPVAGANVLVASDRLPGVRETKSGANGEYFLRGIPPGVYDVEFSRDGLQTVLKRAELQLGETSRLDTEMAVSDVAETVSSTTILPPLLETPHLSTNIDAATVDRLPVGRSVRERLVLAPGLFPDEATVLIDDVRRDDTVHDAIEESNFMTSPLSAEYDDAPLFTTITRSGSNELIGSLRATVYSDDRDRFEGTIGGAAIEDRLWFYGGADDESESLVRATGVVDDRHTILLSHHDELSARWYGVISDQATVEALGHEDEWSLRAHAFVSADGSHSVVAGAEDRGGLQETAFFVNDVWRPSSRWTASIGIRADDRTEPRVGAVYDFRGDGEHRLGASWARYKSADEAVLTYGWRFGVGGYARADYIRRDAERDATLVQLHGSYDLFRLFRVGGNYTAALSGGPELRRRANGWFWFEPHVGDGVMTLSILQRYLATASETFLSTDLGAMYAYPVRAVTTFAKVDLINAFDGAPYTGDELSVERTWRGSIGLRF